MNSTTFALKYDLPHGTQCKCAVCRPDYNEMEARLKEATALLKEARKILLANSLARTMNKDYLQRTADWFKSESKEERQAKLRRQKGYKPE